MSYQFIVTDQQLADCCDVARQVSAVALDTEFVRTRTYYPIPGLIQLFDGQQVSLIDPLPIKDWAPFTELLRDPQVIKYLHAGGEDIEVFLNQFQVVPDPMLDTQIMAAFLDRPASWGFAAMVAEFTGVQLDKSESRTDWLARPLTDRQCAYAAADVEYLLPIALQLNQQVQTQHKTEVVRSECEIQICRRQQVTDPQNAWQEITHAWQLRPRQLAALKMLAEWRLNYARQQNLAVNFVVREEILWKVARYQPESRGELQSLGASGPEIRFHGQKLLDAVSVANGLVEEQLPPPLANLAEQPAYRKLFNDIKLLVKQVSQNTGYSTELLASRRQINQVLSWHWKLKAGQDLPPELLSGWRGDLLAEKIRQILAKAQ